MALPACTTSAEGAPFLRVLCARVGTTLTAQWALPSTPHVPLITLDNLSYNRNTSKAQKIRARTLSTYNSAPAVTYPADKDIAITNQCRTKTLPLTTLL